MVSCAAASRNDWLEGVLNGLWQTSLRTWDGKVKAFCRSRFANLAGWGNPYGYREHTDYSARFCCHDDDDEDDCRSAKMKGICCYLRARAMCNDYTEESLFGNTSLFRKSQPSTYPEMRTGSVKYTTEISIRTKPCHGGGTTAKIKALV